MVSSDILIKIHVNTKDNKHFRFCIVMDRSMRIVLMFDKCI